MNRHSNRRNSWKKVYLPSQTLVTYARLPLVVQTRIEQAAKMLDDIIDDIVCDMSAVQSIGYIYNEVPTETEGDIIRSAIAATASDLREKRARV